MAEQPSIAVEYASQLSHPFRFRLVAALAPGPRTVPALAGELDTAEPVVRHHLDALRKLGFVEEAEQQDGTTTYELLKAPVIWDEEWGELPVEGRRNAAASALTYVGARAAAAVDRGGFDREDVHISRTTLTVDEAGWKRLTELFNDLLRELREREAQPDPPGPTFQATGALLLFTGEQVALPATEGPSYSDEEEALSAADALLDGLAGALVDEAVDWATVETLAERLRLVARGVKESPAAQVIPLHRD